MLRYFNFQPSFKLWRCRAQDLFTCSYDYKLVDVDDKFNRTFKSYLDEDAVYSVVNSMIKESILCTDIMKKHFNKELVMTTEDDEDFENSTKCWICNNVYVDGNVKVRGHCHITGKYIGSAHGDCNTKIKLIDKIPIMFHNLQNYDSHHIIQELVKFSFKTNVIPNGLEK